VAVDEVALVDRHREPQILQRVVARDPPVMKGIQGAWSFKRPTMR
jgi:hypothetical protein